jgi:hypothetical protein
MKQEQIDAWLEEIGRDRAWLANQLGVSLGTVYNWFSKGFSKQAIKGIENLMKPASDGLEVTFSAREFDLIEKARAISGHATRAHYYHDVILEGTERILQAEEQARKIVPLITAEPSVARVAEDPATYNKGGADEDSAPPSPALKRKHG